MSTTYHVEIVRDIDQQGIEEDHCAFDDVAAGKFIVAFVEVRIVNVSDLKSHADGLYGIVVEDLGDAYLDEVTDNLIASAFAGIRS